MTNAGFMPSQIVAGETIWLAAANTAQCAEDITFADYTPAGGYTLSYQFAAATAITVAAVANSGNTGWTLEVTGAQTLVWEPGSLAFTGLVTHTATGRIFAVDFGIIGVQASPLRVSAWTAVKAACDAAILRSASTPNGSFTVDGVTVTYRSTAQLIELREYAAYREKLDSGRRTPRIIRSELKCS